jgi:hypothetical protein
MKRNSDTEVVNTAALTMLLIVSLCFLSFKFDQIDTSLRRIEDATGKRSLEAKPVQCVEQVKADTTVHSFRRGDAPLP